MRLRRMSVVLAAVLAALTLSATAQAAGSRAGVLDRFLPVFVFHPGEEFRPGTVQAFVEDSSLEAATSPTTWVVVDPAPSANDLPTESPPIWRLNQRDCFAGAPLGDLACYVAAGGSRGEPTVYARVVRENNLIVLQYWLFYYDNLYRYPFLPLGLIWQSHEGDWEVVNVVLSKRRQPLAVGYSQHCSGETRDWADTPRVAGRPEGLRRPRVSRELLRARLPRVRPRMHSGSGDRVLPAGRPPPPRRRDRGGTDRTGRIGAARHGEAARLDPVPRLLGRARVLQRAAADRHGAVRDIPGRAGLPCRLAGSSRDARGVALKARREDG